MAGALVVEDYQAKLRAAGFEYVSIEPTRVYEDNDPAALAAEFSVGLELPDVVDPKEIMGELSGSIMSAFVRGQKPE